MAQDSPLLEQGAPVVEAPAPPLLLASVVEPLVLGALAPPDPVGLVPPAPVELVAPALVPPLPVLFEPSDPFNPLESSPDPQLTPDRAAIAHAEACFRRSASSSGSVSSSSYARRLGCTRRSR